MRQVQGFEHRLVLEVAQHLGENMVGASAAQQLCNDVWTSRVINLCVEAQWGKLAHVGAPNACCTLGLHRTHNWGRKFSWPYTFKVRTIAMDGLAPKLVLMTVLTDIINQCQKQR